MLRMLNIIGLLQISPITDHKTSICRFRNERVSSKMMDGALGIVATVALRKAGRDPDIIFGAGDASVEAAFSRYRLCDRQCGRADSQNPQAP
jgi:hypothetical protein